MTVAAAGGVSEALWVAMVVAGGALGAQFLYALFVYRKRQAETIANLVQAQQHIATDAVTAWERLQEENAGLRAKCAALEKQNVLLEAEAANRENTVSKQDVMAVLREVLGLDP